MFKTYEPGDVHKPSAAYSHAVEVPSNARFLFLAGQGGKAPDGTRGKTIEEQCDQTWKNILAILKDADMGPENIIRVTTYASKSEFRDATGAARTRALGNLKPAGTFIAVAGFAMPDMLVEIDIIAAKAN